MLWGSGSGLSAFELLPVVAGELSVGIEGGPRKVSGAAMAETLTVFLTAAPHRDIESVGDGVGRGGSDSVKPGGPRVPLELPTAHECADGFHDAVFLILGIEVDRDTASIVDDLDGCVRSQDNGDARAMTGDNFIEGVIEHLTNRGLKWVVSQRVTDPDADVIQRVECLDVCGGVAHGWDST